MLLWRHSAGTLLAGSIHRLPADRNIPEELLQAYEQTSALVLECKYDNCDPSVRLLPEGRSLGDFVSPRTYRRLRSAAKALQIDLGQLRILKPWACALEVANHAFDCAGFSFEHGLDKYFYRRAEGEGKPVHELEDPRTIAALLGSMDLALQKKLLLEILDNLDELPGRISELVDAWRKDDVDAIDAVQRKMPRPLYERLFVQRNKWWTQGIIKGLKDAPDALILVGCGHLVGKDSLIGLLEAEGVLFERVA